MERPDSSRGRRLGAAAGTCGLLGIVIGAVALAGWSLGAPELRSLAVDWEPMSADAAFCFVLVGFALWIRRPGRGPALRFAADLAAAGAAVTGGVGFGIALLRPDLAPMGPAPDTGFMTPLSAVGFLLLGLSQLSLGHDRGAPSGQLLAGGALLVAILGCYGYVLGPAIPFRVGGLYARLPLHTVGGFALLSVGSLLARPTEGVMAVIVDEGPAGALARRLFPGTVALLVVVGALWTAGQRLGLYNQVFGMAGLLTSNVAAMGLLTWWSMASLRSREEQFRSIFRTSLDAIAVRSVRSGEFVEVNPQFERITGYRRDEIVGHDAGDLGLWAESNAAGRMLAVVAAGGTLYNREADFRTKRGEIRVGLFSGVLSRFDGEPAIMAFVRDITELKRAEEAIRESEARFHSIAETAPVGIFRTDPDGRCVYTNRRWQELTGVGFGESLGEGWLATVHPEDLPRVREAWRACLAETGEADLEFRLQAPQGLVRWVRARGAAIRSRASGVLGLVGTVEDVTDKMAAEQMRHDVVRMLSHDIRSPLSAILGFADLLRQDLEAGAGPGESIDAIESSANQAVAMAMNFLDADRIESGGLTLRRQARSLDDLAADAVAQHAARARLRGVELKVERGPALPAVAIDPALMERAVANLVSNAIKFSRRGGTVTVTTRRHDGGIALAVRDQGPGVRAGERNQLFERYGHAGEARGDSTGLGLFVVKTVVEAHGGRVSAEFPAAGGSVFEIWVPAEPQHMGVGGETLPSP